MDIQKIDLEMLNPARYNPRKDLKPGEPEYEKLKRSIETFGYVEPVVWNKRTGFIVGGHQRYKVLKQLGEKEIDCVVVDMDDSSEKALNIALNKVSGGWDDERLTTLLKDLEDADFDLTLTGFDEKELNDLFKKGFNNEVIEDEYDVDKALDEIETPISKLGDIWLLGKHRLLCGDSTSVQEVKVLMDGKKAKAVFTDPPWNVDYGAVDKGNAQGYVPRTILNDKMSTEDFGAFLMRAFTAMNEVSESGCMTYIVMSGQEWGNLMGVMEELKYHWSSTIIWKKDRLVLSRKDYHTQFEPIWYGWKEGSRLCPLTDRKQSDVWDIPRPTVSVEHPTMKPIELVAKAISNSSYPKDVILDLFGGSGTTIIAAEQTDRICNMMELDPKYCDVIVKRFIALIGMNENVTLLRDEKKIKYVDVI